ncbi:hypothetical protein [Microbacterium sp. 2FI]|uniref:sunset domain-containing protein n=1 Tax=Microbacterium sp. 2FI TaxID=2502193 RepID=UPI0010F653F7|nr:hypothetical protein [Microbacterium sp. 2FI]
MVAILALAIGMLGSPAIAAPTASISGTVTLPAGIEPGSIAVDVELYRVDELFGDTSLGFTATDGGGDYAFPGLEAGSYKLRFAPQSGSGTVTGEWWENQQTGAVATVIVLEEGASRIVDATLDPAASISGHIDLPAGVEAEGGSRYAMVYPADGYPGGAAALAFADENGDYVAGGLAPGAYKVRFSGSGGVAVEWWNDVNRFAAADVITLGLGEARNGVDATLGTAGSISGTVTTDAGAVVDSNMWVWMFAMPVGEDGHPYTPGATSWGAGLDANGEYTIDGLPAGDYTVQFRWGCDCMATVGPYANEFYDGATTVDGATAVTVTPGGATGGIDFSLTPTTLTGATPTISGTAAVGSTLTANAGAWTTGAVLAYQWNAGGMPVTGATAKTLALSSTMLGKAISVTVTGTKAGFEPRSQTSIATPAVKPGALATAQPGVSGTLAVGSTLTATPGTWTSGTAFSYQWLANGAVISGASTSKLSLSTTLKDKSIAVRVTGKRTGYADASRTSAATARVMTAATPSIAGRAETGTKLTAVPNTWTTGTTFSYQWNADGAPISGATSSTFIVGAAQDGKAITVSVKGAKSGWATITKTSKATLRVTRWSTPKVTGTLAYGSTLSIDRGTWSAGRSFTYQWYADGAAISGATTGSLKLGTALKGKQVSVKITGTASGYTTVAKLSASTPRIATAVTPTISGTRAVGARLTAITGTWTSGTTFSYQWLANGVAIVGATGASYVLSSGTESKQISVTVTGRKSGYATIAKKSAATTKVMRAATPTISGTAQVTRTLTASPGSWTAGTTFSYQWYANGAAISGATSKSLTLTTAHYGKTVVVKVTGRLSGYSPMTKSSAATVAIGYPSSTTPADEWNCPSWAPIKGNQDSWIYHMPGQRYYGATKPEACFRTESAAVSAGYRKAKV